MNRSVQVNRQFFNLFAYSVYFSLIISYSVEAQVVPDRTLRNPSSVVRNNSNFVITGGTQTGNNLFHSFQAFSISNGETASFQSIDRSIANILARVTGSSISRINGVIEALAAGGDRSSANLFLINPNGIIFGSNAALNLGGSFLATTADRITFANGAEFSAVRPQDAPLLTVSTPVGLQFGNRPGDIINRSIAPLRDPAGNPVLDIFETPVRGLNVSSGRTLALVGGDVILDQGALNAYGGLAATGGRIELGSVASSETVRLNPIVGGWRLGYNTVSDFGNIQLRQAMINTSGSGGGEIQIYGDRLVLDQSEIFADTFANQSGDNVLIDAARVSLERSRITADTYGRGRAGAIQVRSNQLILQNGAQIAANTYAEGRGGDLSITSTDFIRLTGGVGLPPSGLFVRGSDPKATGRAGSVSVTTDQLRVLRGAQINADNVGQGAVGTIDLEAADIELAGVALSPQGEPLLFRGVPLSPSAVSAFAYPASSGGGSINIETQRLLLRDGAVIQITTTGAGDSGTLRIHASDSIELSGFTPAGREAPTGLLAFSGGIPGTLYDDLGIRTATGRGGDLSLTTEELIVRNRAVVAVGSLNPDRDATGSGNLQIRAETIRLEDQGNLLAATASGNGGNINLQVANLLLLRNNSGISTTAGTAQRGGNGGNITLNTGYLTAAPFEDSNIEANAYTGRGGEINITALGAIGIEPRSRPTAFSDITAKSDFGVSGTIQISTLTDDPSRGAVALPSGIVDAAQMVAQGCTVGSAAMSEFVITGRGGLPPDPADLDISEIGLSNWATLGRNRESDRNRESGNRELQPVSAITPAHSSASRSPAALRSSALVEAQGWMRDEEGRLQLVAQAPASPYTTIFASTQCP